MRNKLSFRPLPLYMERELDSNKIFDLELWTIPKLYAFTNKVTARATPIYPAYKLRNNYVFITFYVCWVFVTCAVDAVTLIIVLK